MNADSNTTRHLQALTGEYRNAISRPAGPPHPPTSRTASWWVFEKGNDIEKVVGRFIDQCVPGPQQLDLPVSHFNAIVLTKGRIS